MLNREDHRPPGGIPLLGSGQAMHDKRRWRGPFGLPFTVSQNATYRPLTFGQLTRMNYFSMAGSHGNRCEHLSKLGNSSTWIGLATVTWRNNLPPRGVLNSHAGRRARDPSPSQIARL